MRGRTFGLPVITTPCISIAIATVSEKFDMDIVQSLQIQGAPVRIYDTHSNDLFNRVIADVCRSGEFEKSEVLNRTSLVNKSTDPIYETLDSIFKQGIKRYLEEIYDPRIFEIFDFWQDWSINVHPGYRALPSHSHNECFLALTYYPEACADSDQDLLYAGFAPYRGGQIAFHAPRGNAAWDKFHKGEKTHQPFGFDAGTLAVFPGYLPHFTVPGGTSHSRVCIASFVSVVTKSSTRIDWSNL